MEASCNLGERGDMLFDDYLDRSCSRLREARQMANKSNPALIFPVKAIVRRTQTFFPSQAATDLPAGAAD
jgi:hypothetical protein